LDFSGVVAALLLVVFGIRKARVLFPYLAANKIFI
tara:strand:+ start:945 stop:1049 length:105 start_codon:yes stop_codon:yes gene_type:complete